MKTLKDYIKGYPAVPTLLIAQYRSKDGTRYSLVKEENYNTFYFMKKDEVIKTQYIKGDKYPQLSLDHINFPKDVSVIEEIKEQPSYNEFVKFIRQETGETFTI